MPKISELPSATAFSGSDLVAIVQGGVAKKIQADNFAATSLESAISAIAEAASSVWSAIPVSGFDATPLSSSTLTATSALVKAGVPVRYTVNGVTLYGIVAGRSGNTITIHGPLIDIGHAITSLAIASTSRVVMVNLFIAGTYAGTTGDKLAAVGNRYARWYQGEGRLVSFSATHKTAATTTQPKINVKAGGSLVSTADGSAGLQMSTAGTWVSNPVASISVANYDVAFGDAIEVNVSSAGSGEAANLSISLVFVLV